VIVAKEQKSSTFTVNVTEFVAVYPVTVPVSFRLYVPILEEL
jgi:hypothetical protein